MAIPDPEKIWPKLDELGPDEVRKRLAMGVFAPNKVPVIEEWLRRQEQKEKLQQPDAETLVRTSIGGDESLYDRFISACKNNKLIVAVLVLGLLIISLGQVTDAFNKISDFADKITSVESTDEKSRGSGQSIDDEEKESTEPLVIRPPLNLAEVEHAVTAQTALIFDVKPSSINVETRFADIESPNEIIPGLGVVELVIELEEQFDCTISDDIAERITSVNDAVLAVMSCK